MPPRPGDQTLIIAFADVHYWISPPTQKPPHHRFEKGSYVYLHHTRSTNEARIEVANNAGTVEQDAFEGSLQHATLKYSHKRPGFLTLEVTLRTSAQDQMWQLKTFDMKHQTEYMYLLSAVDLYFWNPSDASKFIESVQGLHVGALVVQDAPQAQSHYRDPSGTASPVVQKLEQVAIATPYQHGQSNSTSTIQSLPPPPTQAQISSPPSRIITDSAAPPPPPAAYNPAAPAAPEPIAHREKTPPPLEIEDAQRTDQYGMPYQQSQQQQTYHQGQAAPPRQNSIPPPPPQSGRSPAGLGRAGTFPMQSPTQQSFAAPPPTDPSSQNATPAVGEGAHRLYSTSSIPITQNAGNPPQSPGRQPAQSPLKSPQQLPGPPPPQSPGYNSSVQSHTPPGYAQGGYASPPPQQASVGHIPQPHEIHSQAYIPTEAEYSKPAPAGPSGNMGRLEKGVNKWLKRLDKHM